MKPTLVPNRSPHPLAAALAVAAALGLPCTQGQEQDGPGPPAEEEAEVEEGESPPAAPRQLFVQAEFIAVPPDSATRLLESGELSEDDTALRHAVQRMIEREEAAVAETVATVTRNGQRAKTESVRKVPVTVEIQPAQGRSSKGPAVPSTLTAADIPVTTTWELEPVGTTLEIDPVISPDGTTVDLNIALRMIELDPDRDQVLQSIPLGSGSLPTITRPTFYPMAISTAVKVGSGHYALVGVLDPPAPPHPSWPPARQPAPPRLCPRPRPDGRVTDARPRLPFPEPPRQCEPPGLDPAHAPSLPGRAPAVPFSPLPGFSMERRPFSEFGLSVPVMQAVAELGFELASPIQAETIPALLQGRDLVGQSPTGSGKTAAFGIPIVEAVDIEDRRTQAIVLCPTRELALQVAQEFHKLVAFRRGLSVLPVYGGAPIDRQIQALRRGVHVVIGTPGRVLDHLRRGTLDLGTIRTIVLDEADEMLDMGFLEDIETVLEHTPEGRQAVFFSATMPRPIQNLIKRFTNDPITVELGGTAQSMPDIDQVYFEVRHRSKPEVLSRVLDTHEARLTIVFCNTKRMVDELVDTLLARGYSADRLHGDVSQAVRTRVMNSFRAGNVDVLVATDVAARGIDVEQIDLVVNYDLPFDGEDYVHRIGRTGRAGRSGKAVSLVGGRDVYRLQHIARQTGRPIARSRVPTLDELEQMRADRFYDQLHALLEAGDYDRHRRLIDRLLEQGFEATDIADAALHLLLGSSNREAEEIAEDKPEPERPPRRDKRERDGRHDRDHGSAPYDTNRPAKSRLPDHRAPSAASPDGADVARLFFNVGKQAKIGPGDLAGLLYNAGGIPSGGVGSIRLGAKFAIVEVPSSHAADAIERLDGTTLRGRTVRVDFDRGSGHKR